MEKNQSLLALDSIADIISAHVDASLAPRASKPDCRRPSRRGSERSSGRRLRGGGSGASRQLLVGSIRLRTGLRIPLRHEDVTHSQLCTANRTPSPTSGGSSLFVFRVVKDSAVYASGHIASHESEGRGRGRGPTLTFFDCFAAARTGLGASRLVTSVMARPSFLCRGDGMIS